MLELYSDLIAPTEYQADQEIPQNDPKSDQKHPQNDQEMNQELFLSDQDKEKFTLTDQEFTVSDQISDHKIRILSLIKSNSKITRAEIAKIMGIHDSSIKRRLESLIADGLIRRVESTKARHWEVL